MFEINLRIKVNKDGNFARDTVVENTIYQDGKEIKKFTESFDHLLKAYAFVADYFDDMMEEIIKQSGGSLLQGDPKSEVN